MKIRTKSLLILAITCISLPSLVIKVSAQEQQIRARDLGISPGILPTGKLNAITDVTGVSVGHFTLIKGDSIRTGATAVLPHSGNIYQNKVPAAMVIGNGFGKMTGYSQVSELGEIETPILLTNTLNVGNAANAIVQWTLAQPGNEKVRSVNPIVGETNDSKLNDIRGQHLTSNMFKQALDNAKTGIVKEGTVGAGTGTVAFGWKGGIGTSSRVLPQSLGGYTVGVLVQSNYGGILQMNGVEVGKNLGQYYLKGKINNDSADGSIMMVVATDAPLSDRNLKRLATRAMTGLARTGSSMSNGSGDYVISFSVAEQVRRTKSRRNQMSSFAEVPNNKMTPLFQATIEATEEAIYNSLLMATTVTSKNVISGKSVTIHKLPIDKVKALL
ncbi:P1 family peptidase [Colwellia psychrerythraea]|uniref:Peptidase S58 DmpA n=1 Tax=Colwellia psychrerythraea TaxID=28229 RepID=A0A099KMT7_COLPS|nr:P1 family peptidase [Colwellia psychrerythraea]KGJ90968.1 peptidase S58 DmpA [Colwellia psychrerythraea]